MICWRSGLHAACFYCIRAFAHGADLSERLRCGTAVALGAELQRRQGRARTAVSAGHESDDDQQPHAILPVLRSGPHRMDYIAIIAGAARY